MIHYVILTFGYAEDQRVCDMVWYHQSGFKTKTDALRSIAEGFLQWYKEDIGYGRDHKQQCCRDIFDQFDQAAVHFKYCPTCGTSLIDDTSIEEESVSYWFKELSASVLDGFHDEILTDHCGWELTGAAGLLGVDPKKAVIITESAEKTLARIALKDQA